MRWVRKMKRLWTTIVEEIRTWLLIAAVLLAAATAGILLFSPYFNVREINIRRQDARVDIEEVQKILSPLFNERLLFVSRSQVRHLLSVAIPDLQSVEIDKDYPSSLTVTVVLDTLMAEVLIDAIDGSGATIVGSGSGLHRYITRGGYLVSSPIALSDEPYQKITLTDWAIAPTDRTFVFNPEELKTILIASDVLRRDYGLVTAGITYFMRAREYHILTDKAELWFDLASPLSEQLQRFRQFLAEASLDDVQDYIDLRIADTIVYK